VRFEATDLLLLPQDSTDSCPHSHTACNSTHCVYCSLPSLLPKCDVALEAFVLGYITLHLMLPCWDSSVNTVTML
jgi:hypothetical protein